MDAGEDGSVILVVIASQRVRANGSRERAPDDRLREAIQFCGNTLDCFVASLLAMTGEWA
jgi:hypothetical protein